MANKTESRPGHHSWANAMQQYPPELCAKLDTMSAAIQALTDQTSAMLSAIRASAGTPQPAAVNEPTESKNPMAAVHNQYATLGVTDIPFGDLLTSYSAAVRFALELLEKERNVCIRDALHGYVVSASEALKAAIDDDAARRQLAIISTDQYYIFIKARMPCTPPG